MKHSNDAGEISDGMDFYNVHLMLKDCEICERYGQGQSLHVFVPGFNGRTNKYYGL